MSGITQVFFRVRCLAAPLMGRYRVAPRVWLLAAIVTSTSCHSMANRPLSEESRRADATQCDVSTRLEGTPGECALDRQWDSCQLEVGYAFASTDEGSGDTRWTTLPYLLWQGGLRCGDEPHEFALEPPRLSETYRAEDLRFVRLELFLVSAATESGCEVEVVVAGCEAPSCFRDYVPEGSGAASEYQFRFDGLIDYTFDIVTSSNHLALWQADIPHQELTVGIAEAIEARISFRCMKDDGVD
jgi:hypothetical protein